jgi:uncharacterized protein YfaS (alpha-2-macroglobulin family)
MSIRNNVFRIGEVVRVRGVFTTLTGAPNPVQDATLTIKRPDGTLEVFVLDADSAGQVLIGIPADEAGRWRARLECAGTYPSVRESHFDVAESGVLPPPTP